MRTSLFALTMCLFVMPVHAKYSGGTGEPNDPYRIATAADLIALGETPADYDKHFTLTADIDLDPNLAGRKVFGKAVIAPAGNSFSFRGVFDGNSHTISHLTIRSGGFSGLFGALGAGAVVKKLAVVDVNIAGSGDWVGGLAGGSWGGSVDQCYSTGVVDGSECVGGLMGGSDEAGTVTRCYSAGTVRGWWYVGGLVAFNNGRVTECYSAAAVDGSGYVGGLVGSNGGNIVSSYSRGSVRGTDRVGGLIGHNRGSISLSFWDVQTSGQATSDGGTGKTTAEMQTAITFLDAGWDFVGETANGTADIWWINEGKSYPRLSWEGPAGMVFVDIPVGTFAMGDHDGVGGENERPVHAVTLDGFQMSKCETTNDQYAVYLNAAMADGLIQMVNGVVYASSDANLAQPYCDTYTSSSYSQVEYSQGRFILRSRDGKAMSDHPVARVSWYGARAFCDYYGCRLPTEAEWEYAARGGHHDPYYRYPWGSNSIDCSKANCKTDSGFCNPLNLTGWPYTSPVGYYGPQGAYGLCDMSGNLWEWCHDWYDSSYYRVSPAGNPTGPAEGTARVLRGGAWDVHGKSCNVADRSVASPDVRGQVVGFRVCR